jgi:hypothetical protein
MSEEKFKVYAKTEYIHHITIPIAEWEAMKRQSGELIKIAAQMAMKQNMPDVEHVAYSVNIPKKSWRSIIKMCAKSSQQCNDWSYELRKIADNISAAIKEGN